WYSVDPKTTKVYSSQRIHPAQCWGGRRVADLTHSPRRQLTTVPKGGGRKSMPRGLLAVAYIITSAMSDVPPTRVVSVWAAIDEEKRLAEVRPAGKHALRIAYE
ncbi:MAG: hypothetical protein ACRD2G_03425, partial [Terriglobia bacterium]